MSQIAAALKRIFIDLDDLGVSAALVGGLAVSVRGEPRFTRDVDLAVAVVDDTAAEQVIGHLTARGYSVHLVLEHLPSGRMATVRLVPPGGRDSVLVDLLFASSGIEPEVVAEATSLELLPGLSAKVARTGHLIAMKVLSFDKTDRPQDHDDLLVLVRHAGESELLLARKAVALIAERGFSRGRDLHQLLDSAIGTGARH